MSDARAIEAVTETLRSLVDSGVKAVASGANTVTHPPHEVDVTAQEALVNLFLFQTQIDGSLRNELPAGVGPGETGEPALPLVLRYLLTPFVPGGDDLQAHRLLGGALQALHSRPVLTRTELADIAPYSDVSRQVDTIRITWEPFEEKDIFSLWSVFQTPYRLSTVLEVRAVLIDSRRVPRTAPPVLTRSADGRGPQASPGLDSGTVRLDGVRYPSGQPAARVNDAVEVVGANLSAIGAVRLTHLGAGTVVDVSLPAQAATPASVRFAVPSGIPAGISAVTLLAGSPAAELPSGPGYLAVAPTVTSPLPASVARDGAGNAVVSLTASPAFATGQRVAVLLGSDPYSAATSGSTATCTVPHAVPGDHLLRLRVDGVDSLLVLDRTATPPVYDPTQLLTVT